MSKSVYKGSQWTEIAHDDFTFMCAFVDISDWFEWLTHTESM